MRYFRNQIVFVGHDVKERIDESLLSAIGMLQNNKSQY